MTTHGKTSYYISISTGIAGSSPTSSPTGDAIYLYAESWEENRENKDKIKQMANNNSYNNRMGKIAREVNLTRCVLMSDDGGTTSNTAAYNEQITMLDSWCDLTDSAVYLLICPLVDNPLFYQPGTAGQDGGTTDRTVNLCLSRTGAATARDYMKGVPTRMSVKPEGDVFMLNLGFKETTLY